jgi:hypothetical protein
MEPPVAVLLTAGSDLIDPLFRVRIPVVTKDDPWVAFSSQAHRAAIKRQAYGSAINNDPG